MAVSILGASPANANTIGRSGMSGERWWMCILSINGRLHHTIQHQDPLLEPTGPGSTTKKWSPEQVLYRARLSDFEYSLGLSNLISLYNKGLKPGVPP